MIDCKRAIDLYIVIIFQITYFRINHLILINLHQS